MTTNSTTPDTNQPIGIKIGGVFAASTASLKAVGHVVREVTVLVQAITEHTRAETELTKVRADVADAAHQRDRAQADIISSVLGGMMMGAGGRFRGDESMAEGMGSGHAHGSSRGRGYGGFPL